MLILLATLIAADGFSIEDCESSFSKAGATYDVNNGSFKALAKCATLCNVAVFDDKSKFETDADNEFILKNGQKVPIDFFNMREQVRIREIILFAAAVAALIASDELLRSTLLYSTNNTLT